MFSGRSPKETPKEEERERESLFSPPLPVVAVLFGGLSAESEDPKVLLIEQVLARNELELRDRIRAEEETKKGAGTNC